MLGEITIPTFLLSNLDDPLVHKSVIPYDECKANPNIILGTHPCGGHLANLSGWKPHSVFFLYIQIIYIYIYIVAGETYNIIFKGS